MRKLKIVLISIWLSVAVFIANHRDPAAAQTNRPITNIYQRRPDVRLIDRFDNEIHARFLTEPFFGMARLAPTTPVKLRSNHVAGFMPQTPEEIELERTFKDSGWDVGIYLYGRRAVPKLKNGKPQDDFKITYRVNVPVPVTFGLREGQLQDAKGLIRYVKQAFLDFQSAGVDGTNTFEFEKGDWSYVARPVRAVNQSCLKCHNDYVVVDKLANNKFKLKRREVGDVNGILLYAFRKRR
jgi:hypothetical protein